MFCVGYVLVVHCDSVTRCDQFLFSVSLPVYFETSIWVFVIPFSFETSVRLIRVSFLCFSLTPGGPE